MGAIGRRLHRRTSSIAYEISGNSVDGAYDARKAHAKACLRRRQSKLQCLKVAMDKGLKEYVTQAVEDDQSPQGISGRLKYVETERPYASTKAIYKFLRSPHGRRIEGHLYSKAVRKKSGRKRGTPVSIDGRTMIDRRPETVLQRLEFGHFEGDFIESGKEGEGSLLVLVERMTRYPFLAYLDDRSAASVNAMVARVLSGIPVKSVTLDNDISFQKHAELSELIQATIFFCHPRSPHEKGTVENRNKAIRRYVPKRGDIAAYRSVIPEVERTLRTRFMQCLRFRTPQECFDEERGRAACMKKAARGGMLESVLFIH